MSPPTADMSPLYLLPDWDMEAADCAAFTDSHATLTKDTGTYHDGTQSLKIAYLDAASGDAKWASPTFPTSASLTYRLRGWARGDGTAIPIVYTTTGGPYASKWVGTSSTSWQPIDVSFTLGAAITNIALAGSVLSAGKAVWFDGVYIERSLVLAGRSGDTNRRYKWWAL